MMRRKSRESDHSSGYPRLNQNEQTKWMSGDENERMRPNEVPRKCTRSSAQCKKRTKGPMEWKNKRVPRVRDVIY